MRAGRKRPWGGPAETHGDIVRPGSTPEKQAIPAKLGVERTGRALDKLHAKSPHVGAGVRPMNPPFRAEHIGSLLRPAELLRARQQHAAGKLDREGLTAVENEAIRGVVKLQEDVGLQVVTDG